MINRIVSLGSIHAHPTDQTTHTVAITGLIVDARNIHNIDAKYILSKLTYIP